MLSLTDASDEVKSMKMLGLPIILDADAVPHTEHKLVLPPFDGPASLEGSDGPAPLVPKKTPAGLPLCEMRRSITMRE